MSAKVNMANIGTMFLGVGIQFSSNVAEILKGQPVEGCVRFFCSFFIISILTQLDAIVDNGRQRFICHPENNSVHKEQCFERYSDEMSPSMKPNIILWVTYLTLVVFWTFMIQYSRLHFPKIRRATAGSTQREHLCHKYWTMFLLHVGMEAVVLSVLSGLFFSKQKFVFAETFNCTLMIAPVMTCMDKDHQDKPWLYSGIFFWMTSTSLLGCGTFFYQICNRENFLKELLAQFEADDGANNFTNAQSSGSSGFTNTGNPNQQQDDGANNFTNAQSSGSSGFTNTGNPNQQQDGGGNSYTNTQSSGFSGFTNRGKPNEQQDDGANNFTNAQSSESSGFTNTGNPNQQQDGGVNYYTNTQSSGSSGFTKTGNPNEQQGPALDVTSTMSSATLIPSGFASNGIRHRKAGGGSDNPKIE